MHKPAPLVTEFALLASPVEDRDSGITHDRLLAKVCGGE
jgi:hypothetical protein